MPTIKITHELPESSKKKLHHAADHPVGTIAFIAYGDDHQYWQAGKGARWINLNQGWIGDSNGFLGEDAVILPAGTKLTMVVE